MRLPLCLPGSPAVYSRDMPCGRRGRSLWEGHPGQHGEGVSRTGAEVQARTTLGSRLHPPAHGVGGQNEAIAVGLGAGGGKEEVLAWAARVRPSRHMGRIVSQHKPPAAPTCGTRERNSKSLFLGVLYMPFLQTISLRNDLILSHSFSNSSTLVNSSFMAPGRALQAKCPIKGLNHGT